MERPLLNDAAVYPDSEVLASALQDAFRVYQSFESQLPEHSIALEWRYYNDGKSWLAKGSAGKKTVFWLSVWQGYFCASFFFTEKNRQGVQALPIAQALKTQMQQAPMKGRLAALVAHIAQPYQLDDLFTLIAYKKSCK